MTMTSLNRAKAAAFDANGRLLVFAAPIIAGIHGAPLALSSGKTVRRSKTNLRKNWAKRRAYSA